MEGEKEDKEDGDERGKSELGVFKISHNSSF